MTKKENTILYEVGIDLEDEGTMTLAEFPTKEEAQLFMSDYYSKHPNATLFIDTCTSDYLNEQSKGK